MALSCFTPCGLLEFSSGKPLAQSIYDQIKGSHGPAYDAENFYGVLSAKWYADAMALAAARKSLERAQNQADPWKVSDLLDDFEVHYGIVVPTGATLESRHEALAAVMQLTLGPKRGNVEYQLRAALGDDFVAWVTTDAGPDTSFPAQPWLTSAIFGNPSLWKTVAITPSVHFTGTPITVEFTHQSGDDGALLVGDKLVVDPGELGQQELVTVTDRTDSTFTATFARPHGAGTMAIRRPWPVWCSTTKHSLVVVPHGRARDQLVREAATRVLRKLLPDNSTWDIVEEDTTPGTTGGFLPGVGEPGITPIVQVTL